MSHELFHRRQGSRPVGKRTSRSKTVKMQLTGVRAALTVTGYTNPGRLHAAGQSCDVLCFVLFRGLPIIRPLPFLSSLAMLTLLPGEFSMSSTLGTLSPTATALRVEAWNGAALGAKRRRAAWRAGNRRRVANIVKLLAFRSRKSQYYRFPRLVSWSAMSRLVS
jgi:hypothetical protein